MRRVRRTPLLQEGNRKTPRCTHKILGECIYKYSPPTCCSGSDHVVHLPAEGDMHVLHNAEEEEKDGDHRVPPHHQVSIHPQFPQNSTAHHHASPHLHAVPGRYFITTSVESRVHRLNKSFTRVLVFFPFWT